MELCDTIHVHDTMHIPPIVLCSGYKFSNFQPNIVYYYAF